MTRKIQIVWMSGASSCWQTALTPKILFCIIHISTICYTLQYIYSRTLQNSVCCCNSNP